MKYTLLTGLLLFILSAKAQTSFKECGVSGSVTLFNQQQQQWIFSDSTDAMKGSLPASTFKIINLLIALETGVIRSEQDTVRWPGYTDTAFYGYRPDIYKDMTVQEAFEVSAGWVFMELAKRIGRERYLYYLKACGYGNLNLSEKGTDFWDIGPMHITPVGQINFLRAVYEESLPFSPENYAVLKKLMITHRTSAYTIRSKTGWTKVDGRDIGWWVGYLTRGDKVWFFATRITKSRTDDRPGFGKCRINITFRALEAIHAISPASGSTRYIPVPPTHTLQTRHFYLPTNTPLLPSG